MVLTTGRLIDSVDQDEDWTNGRFRWFPLVFGVSGWWEISEQEQLSQGIERPVCSAAGEFLGELSTVATSDLPSCIIRFHVVRGCPVLDQLGEFQQPVSLLSGWTTDGNEKPAGLFADCSCRLRGDNLADAKCNGRFGKIRCSLRIWIVMDVAVGRGHDASAGDTLRC